MIAGVVLAAGASTRAGYPKALATLDGEPLAARIARTLADAGCTPVVVVVGPPHADRVRAAVPAACVIVHNPAPERGMLSSLRVAIEALAPEVEAAVVALVDHPRVGTSTVTALVQAWRTRGAAVVRPTLSGRRGHPYLVDRSVFAALEAAADADGARPVLARATPTVDVAVEDPAILDDLDTADGLARAGVLPPRPDGPRNG